MAFEGWISFAGVELVSTARAAAYSATQVRCDCDHLAASLGDDPYTDPVTDRAPWYDPGAPHSKDFHGLVGLGVTGAESATNQRQWTELIGDGGVPGTERQASREIEVKALAMAATHEALTYGMSWLSSALRGSACLGGCDGDELCLYVTCPAPPSAAETVDCDDPATVAQPDPDPTLFDPAAAGDELVRTLFDVARIEGPTVTSRRELGTGVVAEVTFVVKAGVPHFYRQPNSVADLVLHDLPDTAYQDLLPGYDPVGWLADCEAQQRADCLQENPYAVAPPWPAEPVIEVADPSYPTSRFTAARIVYTVGADTNPTWLERVPVITVRSGSLPLHRFTIRFYDNPLGYPCGGDLNPCLACAEITMPWIPRSSVLTIDGRTSTAMLECPDSAATSATHALYGPGGGLYTWPVFDCPSGMCVEILADSAGVAQDMRVQVDLATREDTA